jgi:hypothetical protein
MRYWPPFAPLGVSVGVWSGGSDLPPGRAAAGFGVVAGGPDRHRGWLFCPSPVPAPAGRGLGLRPRVFRVFVLGS